MLATFAVIAFAALIHASFQLSVSVLTLLSGHAIGKKTAHHRLMHLTGSFVGGVALITLLLVATAVLLFTPGYITVSPLTWSVVSGLLIGVGIAVWVFYYRRDVGTTLWIPRQFARFLSDRTKATKGGSEAFSLGVTSVLSELLFVIAPLAAAALAISTLPANIRWAGIALYVVLSLLSLAIVAALVGGGHTLGAIQRWREQNKHFLQFAAGSGLLVLGLYMYVSQVVSASAIGTGGF